MTFSERQLPNTGENERMRDVELRRTIFDATVVRILRLFVFADASFSASFHIWTPAMVDEVHRLGARGFVNVLGIEDTSQNQKLAIEMGFDFIQTDRQSDILKMN